jgi:putative methyltransferase (TIGR04325 family)
MFPPRRIVTASLRRLLPSSAYEAIEPLLHEYGYFGDYASWDEALRDSTGYDHDLILDKTRQALLKVKTGEARAERDSVLLADWEFSFPAVAALLRVALENDGSLSVLDFGGSLGSSYFQTRAFGAPFKRLEWSVVEQPHYVDCGKRDFENGELAFFPDIDACLRARRPHVLLLSSVLPYLREPYAFLADVVRRPIPHLIVDDTYFRDEPTDRLVVQRVPPEIYPASYPAWILSRPRFLEFMEASHRRLTQFAALRSSPRPARGQCLGFTFQKADSPAAGPRR